MCKTDGMHSTFNFVNFVCNLLFSLCLSCFTQVKSKRSRSGIEVESYWSRSEVEVKSKWNRSDIEVKSKWSRSEVEVKSKWSRSAVEVKSFWKTTSDTFDQKPHLLTPPPKRLKKQTMLSLLLALVALLPVRFAMCSLLAPFRNSLWLDSRAVFASKPRLQERQYA